MKPSLSIVIPCYNEAENILPLLERFEKIRQQHPFELVLVNNGSADHTVQVLNTTDRQRFHFLKIATVEKNVGYGHGIITGLKEASGDVLAWTHADLQTDPADVIRAFELFQKHPHQHCLVKGSRTGRSLGDRLFTWGMSLFASAILRGWYSEINAQPKLFPRDFFDQHLPDPPHDFSLDLYLLAQAKKHRYSLVAFPVFFTKRLHGQSSWSSEWHSRWKITWRTVKYIFKLCRILNSS